MSYDPEENIRKEKEKAIWRLEATEQYKKELQENPEFHEYIKNYRTYPGGTEHWMNDYVQEKIRWIEWGPNYKKYQETEDLQWVNDAFKRLEEIQQKKLFDLQCMWRAEKITIPGIECTSDFKYWECHILNCPFLDKITDEEFAMYEHYLKSLNFEFEQGWLTGWQDYEDIKEADASEGENRNFPDWYSFHNGRTGNSIYLTFPDIRGEKEMVYIILERKAFWAEHEQKQEEREIKIAVYGEDPSIDKRKNIDPWNPATLRFFISTFEDKLTQQKYKDYNHINEVSSHGDFKEVRENIEILSQIGKVVPVQANLDWKEAIREAAEKYKLIRIAEALPEAYNQYCMQYDLNLGFYDKEPSYFRDTMDIRKGFILKGREMMGEPRDFNF